MNFEEIDLDDLSDKDTNRNSDNNLKIEEKKKSNIDLIEQKNFDEEKIVVEERVGVDEKTIINKKRFKKPKLCKRKKKELVPRDVYINDPSRNNSQGFGSNFAKTYKYNLVTFAPIFLFEQFTRVANVYFLLISILQLIPGLSPTGRFTTLATLIFVLTVNGIKDALEDFQRHKQDRIVNTRKIEVVRGGDFMEIEWQDLMVGDIVRLMNDAFIPADIIVLSTSDEKNSRCYIETSNMDGESDYKPRKGLVDTSGYRDLKSISQMKGVVKAEAPNKTITHFAATLNLSDSKEGKPLSQEHLLYRGASLKNTDWVFGLVIYTGNDTKLVLNSKKAKLKRSNVERKLNLYIFSIFALLLVLIIICTVGYGVWSKTNAPKSWYLMLQNQSLAEDTFVAFLSFFILYGGYLVPISLYVTIELVKVWQAFYINSDLEMYYPPNDTPALTRSSGLTEELGQVHYIFSDKTGTLTQNQMQFRKCSIGGIKYGLGYTEISLSKAKKERKKIEERVIRLDSELEDRYVNFLDNNFIDEHEETSLFRELKSENTDYIVEEYFKCLALCHTIIPQDKKEGKYEKFYQSASPDEAALVRAARYFGYELMDRNDEIITYRNKGEIYKYKPLQIIEFSSKRKRMSVLVRDINTNKVYLYSKGADDVIFDRLDKTVDQPLRPPTTEHLEEFGNDGLRTLAIGYREVPSDFYEKWNHRWNELDKMVGERSKVEKEKELLAEEIEVSLTLLGATALEDKLQEGVPDAIEKLLEAGIKMWVLTGDKLETAINISFACSLLDDNMDIMEIEYEWPKNILSKSQIEEEEKKAENYVSDKINLFLEKISKRHERRKIRSQNKQENKKSLNLKHIKGDEEMHEKRDKDDDSTEDSSDSYDHASSPPMDQNAIDEQNFEKDNLALVISGLALKYALLPYNEDKFEKLTRSCKSVVCCRVSPAQKAEVVSLVKRKQTIISLAIGDGANDVSMIQEAHVGVGINGEEGSQASRTADFAIAQFRFLVPLLLFHGRYSYRRISKLIQYSFYKNCVLTMTQFWFCLANAFTGQNLYEQWTLSVFNVIFASLPVITFAILDEDVGKSFVLKNPKLYMQGQKNSLFTPKKFLTWMFNAILQSIIICFLTLGIFSHDVINEDGKEIGMYGIGLVVYSCVILVITLKIAMESYRWVWFHHLVVWGSLFLFFVWNVVYAALYSGSGIGPEYYWVFYRLLATPVFYFSILLIVATSILPSYIYIFLTRTYRPRNHHLIAEMEKVGKIITLKKKKQEKKEKVKQEGGEKKRWRYRGFAFTQGITSKVLNEEITK